VIATADLGDDADNIRVDERAGRIYVASGDGALTALDPRTLARLGEIPLKGHPEGFQLSPRDTRIFVNVPDAREIAVIDRSAGKQIASWPPGSMQGNFPMAIAGSAGEVLSVFRSPSEIVAYRMASGEVARRGAVCSDADDVFVDAKRGRLYVICGDGVVDVLKSRTLERIARIPTSVGARTGLFSPDMDLLLVGARRTSDSDAAVWILKPGD
jgi:DNA-binding beta-propeller fold protein YncE